jgi:hypothetical protein
VRRHLLDAARLVPSGMGFVRGGLGCDPPGDVQWLGE